MKTWSTGKGMEFEQKASNVSKSEAKSRYLSIPRAGRRRFIYPRVNIVAVKGGPGSSSNQKEESMKEHKVVHDL